MRVVGGQDSSFDLGDILEFYGQPKVDPFTTQNCGPPACANPIYESVDFTDTNVYLLDATASTARLRMATIDGTPGALTAEPSFQETAHAEVNDFFAPLGNHDPFYWSPSITVTTTTGFRDLSVPLPGLASAAFTAPVVVRLLGVTTLDAVNPDHRTRLTVNGIPATTTTLDWDGEVVVDHTTTCAQSSLTNPATLHLEVVADAAISVDQVRVDYAEIGYRRLFQAVSDRLAYNFPNQSAKFSRFDGYWGTKANPDSFELKLYAEEAPMILAIQGDEVDFVEHFSVSGGQALLTDPNVQVIAIGAATHRQIHMRTDMEPFTDKRVRQAIALSLDRNAMVDGLWDGKADLGNDSPFAPLYPSTDTSVPQRQQNIDQAKQLLADAGKTGFSVDLSTWNGFEIPDLAQLVKQYASEIGVTINVKIVGDDSAYYGDAVFGKSIWLDSIMGITDYGHRPVPNVFLSSVYTSKGTWNAAHFKNAQADQLIADYIAALGLDSQRAAAKKVQELLLDETPVSIPYFYNFLSAAKPTLKNAVSAATGQFDLSKAGYTS